MLLTFIRALYRLKKKLARVRDHRSPFDMLCCVFLFFWKQLLIGFDIKDVTTRGAYYPDKSMATPQVCYKSFCLFKFSPWCWVLRCSRTHHCISTWRVLRKKGLRKLYRRSMNSWNKIYQIWLMRGDSGGQESLTQLLREMSLGEYVSSYVT